MIVLLGILAFASPFLVIALLVFLFNLDKRYPQVGASLTSTRTKRLTTNKHGW
jgi:hypothetical protein